jgi:hypothetical protein
MAEKKSAPISKRGGARPNSGGRRPGAGRPKGSKNKLTKTVRDAIIAAFDEVGGPRYLAQQAKTNPTAFMALLAKVLPTQLTGADDEPLLPPTVTFVRDPS